MSIPTALDSLKHTCLNGIDTLDFVLDRLGWMQLDDDDPDIEAIRATLSHLNDMFHESLQSHVPYMLASPLMDGGAGMPHSNTYEHGRFYSDGSPVYHDEHCTVPVEDEDGVTHLVPSTRRVFHPLPGGEPA